MEAREMKVRQQYRLAEIAAQAAAEQLRLSAARGKAQAPKEACRACGQQKAHLMVGWGRV